jgi:hypothetical protein
MQEVLRGPSVKVPSLVKSRRDFTRYTLFIPICEEVRGHLYLSLQGRNREAIHMTENAEWSGTPQVELA